MRRTLWWNGWALAALAIVGTGWAGQSVWAQQAKGGRRPAPTGNTAPNPSQRPGQGQGEEVPKLVPTYVPVKPTDPIAVINGETITRQDLANECVAQKGKEVLEAMIGRKLIEQEVRRQKLEITSKDIDAEIDRVAASQGLDRETWLRALDKERGISPAMYARNIIYPTVALRKLASVRVQVTEQDVEEGFAAYYGEKLRCRVIMVPTLMACQEIWNELKQNPGAFERLARDRSIDQATKSLGGLLASPLTRHAYPRNVSDAAFRQLVDGDPDDKDHKPQDGDFTGPIQVNEAAWILLRRESVEPAQEFDRNNPDVVAQMKQLIFEAKLKGEIEKIYYDLTEAAGVENMLTGEVKLAHESQRPESQLDTRVERMSKPDEEIPPTKPEDAPTDPSTPPTTNGSK